MALTEKNAGAFGFINIQNLVALGEVDLISTLCKMLGISVQWVSCSKPSQMYQQLSASGCLLSQDQKTK